MSEPYLHFSNNSNCLISRCYAPFILFHMNIVPFWMKKKKEFNYFYNSELVLDSRKNCVDFWWGEALPYKREGCFEAGKYSCSRTVSVRGVLRGGPHLSHHQLLSCLSTRSLLSILPGAPGARAGTGELRKHRGDAGGELPRRTWAEYV